MEICLDAVYYVKPLDITQIFKAMQDILTNDKMRNNFIEKGTDRVKLFDKKLSVNKHLQLIKEMLYES